jgi:hypothetical protein
VLKLFAVLALAGALCACSAAQVSTAQTDVASVTAALNSACADVTSVPVLASVQVYVTAACVGGEATAAIVSKALSDPTTVAWVESLKAPAS